MSKDSPTIAHVDMDAFFARVEKLDNPDLRSRPVVVGGLGPRGVVSTACYRAREYGVTSAMPTSEARERCPEATFLPPRTERYREFSERIRELFREVTPRVQPVSLDEAYLDVGGVLHHYDSPEALARWIRHRLRDATELTASVGIGPNTMIAKLASDDCKPDGYRVVPPDERESFMATLDVGAIPGIGPETLSSFHDRGIRTVADLQSLPVETLTQFFGQRGVIYDRKARGLGRTALNLDESTQSISHEETYPENVRDRNRLRDRLSHLTGKVGRRLREKDFEARTVFLKLRRGDFTTFTRQRTVADPLASTESLWELVRSIFREEVRSDERGFRLQGVGVTNLRARQVQQDLFSDDRKNTREDLNDVIDDINESLGERSVVRARDLRNQSEDD